MDQVKNPYQSQSAEDLTEDFFIKKNQNFFKVCRTSDRNKKILPQTLMEYSITKTQRQNRYQIFRKIKREQYLIQWKKARAEFKSSAKKNTNEDWEKLTSSHNYSIPINEVRNRVRQLKSKDTKKSEHT